MGKSPEQLLVPGFFVAWFWLCKGKLITNDSIQQQNL